MKLSKSRKLVYAILFALAVAGYPGRALLFPEMDAVINLRLVWISFGVAALTWEFFYFLNKKLARIFPLDTDPVPRVIIQIITGACVIFLARAVGLMIVRHYFPLEFDWTFRAAIYAVDFFFATCLNAGFFLFEYFQKWKQSIDRAERLEKEKAQVTLQSIGDAVITTDADGRIEYLNPEAAHLVGHGHLEREPVIDEPIGRGPAGAQARLGRHDPPRREFRYRSGRRSGRRVGR